MTGERLSAAKVLVLALGLAGAVDRADAEDGTSGEALYRRHCLTCHQADGGGVPFLQPSLLASPIVTGPADLLIRWTLQGSPDPAAPGPWANAMPGFASLSDEALAALLTYIRRDFDHGLEPPPSAVTREDVAAAR